MEEHKQKIEVLQASAKETEDAARATVEKYKKLEAQFEATLEQHKKKIEVLQARAKETEDAARATVEQYNKEIEVLQARAKEAEDTARATGSAGSVGVRNEGGVVVSCPCPFSYVLEQHGMDPTHGDVCRDPSGAFDCPKGCFAQSPPSAPWCMMNVTKPVPCRFSEETCKQELKASEALAAAAKGTEQDLGILDAMPRCPADAVAMIKSRIPQSRCQRISTPPDTAAPLQDMYALFATWYKKETNYLVVMHMATGKIQRCLKIPSLQRPWKFRFFNHTLLYSLTTEADTTEDHALRGGLLFVDLLHRPPRVTFQDRGFPGGTHDLFLHSKGGQLHAIWLQNKLVDPGVFEVCGLNYGKLSYQHNKHRIEPIPPGKLLVDDIVETNIETGQETWRLASKDYLLALGGWPNCSKVEHEFAHRKGLQGFDQFWTKTTYPEWTHANSVHVTGDEVVVSFLSLGSVVAFHPPNPRPVWAVGMFGAHATPFHDRSFDVGHMAIPTTRRSFTYFSNRRIAHVPDIHEFYYVKPLNAFWLQGPPIDNTNSAKYIRLTNEGTPQLQWAINEPHPTFHRDPGGDTTLIAKKIAVVTWYGATTIHDVHDVTAKRLLACHDIPDTYAITSFYLRPQFTLKSRTATAVCVEIVGLYENHHAVQGTLTVKNSVTKADMCSEQVQAPPYLDSMEACVTGCQMDDQPVQVVFQLLHYTSMKTAGQLGEAQ